MEGNMKPINEEEFAKLIQSLIEGKTTRKKLAKTLDTDIRTLNNKIRKLSISNPELYEKYVQTLMKARDLGAEFDARIFNIPKDEVCNYLFWRQDDASRNSIQMVGHAYFSDKEMQKKSNEQIQEMLWSRHNINWNNLPIPQKRGTCCIKVETEMERNGEKFMRKKWTLDKEIPIFTGEGREYVEKHIFLD
jgi:tRNA(His) 5'-end guanylyltransferase